MEPFNLKNRYAVLEGPWLRDQAPKSENYAAGSIGAAWCYLFSQPLDRLLHHQRTGKPHPEEMQWQVFDRLANKSLLTVYAHPAYAYPNNRIMLRYDDERAHYLAASKLVFGLEGPVPGQDEILLATFQSSAKRFLMQPGYLEIAAAALRFGPAQELIESKSKFAVQYNFIRQVNGGSRLGEETHYIPTMAGALASMLSLPLGQTSAAQSPTGKVFGYNRIALQDYQHFQSYAHITTDQHGKAFLVAYPNLGELTKLTGMDPVGMLAYQPALDSINIGQLQSGATATLIPGNGLRQWQAAIAAGQNTGKITAGTHCPFQVHVHLPTVRDITTDQWIRTHHLTAAAALHDLLHVDLVALVAGQNAGASATIVNADGSTVAGLQTHAVGKKNDGPTETDLQLVTDHQFTRILPTHLQLLTKPGNLLLATTQDSRIYWTPSAITLRTTLEQYMHDQLRSSLTSRPSLDLPKTQGAAYHMEVACQPLQSHYLDHQADPVFHQYAVGSFEQGAALLTGLQPDFFQFSAPATGGSPSAVEKITLYSNRQQGPIMMAEAVRPDPFGVCKAVELMVVAPSMSQTEENTLKQILAAGGSSLYRRTRITGKRSLSEPLPKPVTEIRLGRRP